MSQKARNIVPTASSDVSRVNVAYSAEGSNFDTYSGPYLIDHLDAAIAHGDSSAVGHFFSLLLPRDVTHETVARILCERNAAELLTELIATGYWPPADVLRELLGISATAGSCHVMSDLFELAADRGIDCDALATGWVSALAGQAGTGPLIRRINQRYPGSAGVQSVLRALEAAHAQTLDAVLECLVEEHRDSAAEPPVVNRGPGFGGDDTSKLNRLIASLVHDCLDALTVETATVLLAHGLDPSITDTSGKTLIERVLLLRSATVELKAVFHQWIDALPDATAMTMYVLTGDDAGFVKRCQTGCDVSITGFNVQAALNAAISRDHIALARVLLTMGAQLNATGDAEPPALFFATSKGAAECVDLLLEAKADPNAFIDPDGYCCLTLAALEGHQPIVRRLLDSGADATRYDGEGNTALHYAAVHGDVDLCARLLRAGAAIDARNLNNGSTPLALACRLGKRRDCHDVIGFLLDMGADIETVDCEGQSPLALATLSAQAGLQSILLEHGAVSKPVSQKGMGGLRSIARKMILMIEKEKRPDPARHADQVSPTDEIHDYDQAA